jgi:hypothetical protein
VRKVLAGFLATTAVALLCASVISAAPGMKIGFYDEALTLGYPDDFGFRTLKDLRAQVLRMNLSWYKVANSRPANPANPDDPAYDWSQYDTALGYAQQYGIQVLLSIFGTPGWANGGKSFQYAPNDMSDLEGFAEAAAKRYNGGAHPRVSLWAAGNEPNAPNFLRPQSELRNGKWVFVSPGIYAQICNAVVRGIAAGPGGAKVACGVLNPNGKLVPNGKRDSVAPVLFLRLMAAAGASGMDAIAINPYPYSKLIRPNQFVKSKQNVPLGNISVFIKAVDRAYSKRMRIWVTEYAYQTDPPDKHFGVPWATQAKYLTQGFKIMRKNPRIDYGFWFEIKDDSRLEGWQSGVISTSNVKKPSYAAFRNLR